MLVNEPFPYQGDAIEKQRSIKSRMNRQTSILTPLGPCNAIFMQDPPFNVLNVHPAEARLLRGL